MQGESTRNQRIPRYKHSCSQNHVRHEMKRIAQEEWNKIKGLFIFKASPELASPRSLEIKIFMASSLVMTILLPKLEENQQGNSPKFPISPPVVKGALLSEHKTKGSQPSSGLTFSITGFSSSLSMGMFVL